jgi:hypothetical protein
MTGLQDFIQPSGILDLAENAEELFPSLGEGRETSSLLGPLERANLNCSLVRWLQGPNKAVVSLPSPEEGSRSSSRNVFSKYLEFRTMDEIPEPSGTEGYTPSSEPFTSRMKYVVQHSSK